MTAGLPGAGIGGLFYLASALLMPVREAVGFVRDPLAPRRWGVALRQAALAGGIIAALWATGWLLGLVLPTTTVIGDGGAAGAAHHVTRNAVKTGTILFSFGTLALVLVLVQVGRLVARRLPARALPAPPRIPTPLAVRALREPIAERPAHGTRWRRVGENSGQFRRYGS
jgi:hypothetical protein